MVRMVRMFYEVRLSRTCFLISRRRSKPQCGSINLCNPFARSAGIFLQWFYSAVDVEKRIFLQWKRGKKLATLYNFTMCTL